MYFMNCHCRLKCPLTLLTANPGLPGPPEECRVTRETNASLTVVCSPGWSGGLHQTFHLGQEIQPNID